MSKVEILDAVKKGELVIDCDGHDIMTIKNVHGKLCGETGWFAHRFLGSQPPAKWFGFDNPNKIIGRKVITLSEYLTAN